MNYRRLSFSTDYFVFESLADCEPMDQALMHAAMDKVPLAYAPYSRFHVGAALRLELGVIFSGNNQENAAFPLGSCAERVTCGYAKAHYPDSIIEAMAIYVSPLDHQLDHAISPCGGCRQMLLEYELNQKRPIKLILQANQSPVMVIESVANLLPLHFYGKYLQKN